MSPHHAFETITTFLHSPGFDPSANDNRALQFACRNGHLEVVALLSKDPRISPLAGNIAHLWVAAGNGQLDLVKVLLEDERFYLRGEISLALRAAVMGNHIAVVELLLEHPWVDPNSGSMQNTPILQASELGFLDIVKLLLDHPKINPTIWNFQALANALEKGHFDVVQLLLADYEVRCCILGLEILDIGSHQEGDTISTRLLLAQGTGRELEIKCTQAFLHLLNETEESVEE
ncbi:ankyrin repeat-containing domain protein [Obelidium mucronatum]|nr:ankyrin repeat-containing domain protein [Obelidium mucronatum]